jgi:hypothetical protein
VLLESATWTVKVKLPAVVGDPVISSVEGGKVKPGGSEPDPDKMLQVYGAVPPVAVKI